MVTRSRTMVEPVSTVSSASMTASPLPSTKRPPAQSDSVGDVLLRCTRERDGRRDLPVGQPGADVHVAAPSDAGDDDDIRGAFRADRERAVGALLATHVDVPVVDRRRDLDGDVIGREHSHLTDPRPARRRSPATTARLSIVTSTVPTTTCSWIVRPPGESAPTSTYSSPTIADGSTPTRAARRRRTRCRRTARPARSATGRARRTPPSGARSRTRWPPRRAIAPGAGGRRSPRRSGRRRPRRAPRRRASGARGWTAGGGALREPRQAP